MQRGGGDHVKVEYGIKVALCLFLHLLWLCCLLWYLSELCSTLSEHLLPVSLLPPQAWISMSDCQLPSPHVLMTCVWLSPHIYPPSILGLGVHGSWCIWWETSCSCPDLDLSACSCRSPGNDLCLTKALCEPSVYWIPSCQFVSAPEPEWLSSKLYCIWLHSIS